ncbi:hypothetical protein [Clostridium massiliamazoniense]|uniref:hypothetical protein n=1 Tax=Clostridium massiliamazoniense TaxID=1347366 RepID=UPI0006D80749|nr:hypothetical protein [Clostridium massiliamazoniense]
MKIEYEYTITKEDFTSWLDINNQSNLSLKKSALYKSLFLIAILFWVMNSKFNIENKYNFYMMNIAMLFFIILFFFLYYISKKMNNKIFNFFYYSHNETIFGEKYKNKKYCIVVSEQDIKIKDENSTYNLNKENLSNIKITNEFVTITSSKFRDFFIPLNNEEARKVKSFLIDKFSEKIIRSY